MKKAECKQNIQNNVCFNNKCQARVYPHKEVNCEKAANIEKNRSYLMDKVSNIQGRERSMRKHQKIREGYAGYI